MREALQEREVVWAMAPHIVCRSGSCCRTHAGLRPWWLLRLGLFLYDNLGGRKLLPGTRSLDLSQDAAGTPLRHLFVRGFEYSDCWVEDSRLVALNARDAAERGATIRTRCGVTGAERVDGGWRVTARHADGREESVIARTLVNAAGPWVADVLRGVVRSNSGAGVRLVQGSHIVVRKLYDHDRCYIFPERRRSHHLRHSLRGRLHADRHHRHRLQGRPRGRRRERKRDRLSLRGGE